MKQHPRNRVVATATADLRTLVRDFRQERDLTDTEMLTALTVVQEDVVRAMLRAERHPGEPWRRATEA